METELPELKNFIETFCKSNKIKIHIRSIDLSTSIDLDPDIFDLSMDLFLTDFIQQFKIDYPKFDWKHHRGYPQDSARIGYIRFLFGYKMNLSKKLILLFYQPKLFVSDLQTAIQTKELI